MSLRVIAHLDLDCFYAQVEHKRLEIELGQPLVVIQWASAIAVNYAARSFGIKRGFSVQKCKQVCPNIVLAEVDYIGTGDQRKVTLERYRNESAAIMAVLEAALPPGCIFERASIDEAYIDLSVPANDDQYDSEILLQTVNNPETTRTVDGSQVDISTGFGKMLVRAAHIVHSVREAVFHEKGYTMSAGIAANKLLAKQASAFHKPNKQTLVTPSAVNDMLHHLPLKDLRGLGGKLGKEVKDFINPSEEATTANLMVTEIQKFDRATLCSRFGGDVGKRLYEVCRGIDNEPLNPDKKRVKSIMTFKSFSSVNDFEGLEAWVRILAEEVVDRLTKNGRRPKTLVVGHIGDSGGNAKITRTWEKASVTRSCPFPPQGHKNVDVLVKASMSLIKKMDAPLPCIRISISATNLTDSSTGLSPIKDFFKVRSVTSSATEGGGEREVKHGVSNNTDDEREGEEGVHRDDDDDNDDDEDDDEEERGREREKEKIDKSLGHIKFDNVKNSNSNSSSSSGECGGGNTVMTEKKSSNSEGRGNLKRVFADMSKSDASKWKCPLCDELNPKSEPSCHFCQCAQPEPKTVSSSSSTPFSFPPQKIQATKAKAKVETKGNITSFFTKT